MTCAIPVLTLLFTLRPAFQTTSPPDATSDVLNAIADAFDDNRSRFRMGTATFDYWDGFADDVEAAVRGELRDGRKADGRFVFDGADALYSVRFPDGDMLGTYQGVASNEGSNRLSSFRLVTNGQQTFRESFTVIPEGGKPAYVEPVYVILPGSESFHSAAQFPLDLAHPDLARRDFATVLRRVLRKEEGYVIDRVEEDVPFDGRNTVRIALTGPYGKRTYWVDLERGAIPLAAHDDVEGKGSFDVRHGDLRFVEGHGWLPFATTTVLRDGRVFRLIVRDVDFDRPPGPSAFRIELDRVRMVGNAGSNRYYQQKVIDLNALPADDSPESKPMGTARPLGGPVLPGEVERGLSWWPYAVGATLIVVGLALYVRRRRT